MIRVLAVLAALVVGGCSIFNDPDRNPQPPGGSGGDGGTGGMGTGGFGGDPGVELFCDDDLDDDNDTLTDCDDSDCAEEPACCERRSTTLDENWDRADLRDLWVLSPTDDWSPNRVVFNGENFVGDFGLADQTRALVSGDCVSLALGGWVSTTLRSTDGTGCTNDEPCERYAGVVLSTETVVAPGGKLQDELAVTLHAGGLVLVTQADVELARTTTGVDQDTTVEVLLRPRLNDAQQPILVATVSVAGEMLLEEFPVAPIQTLVAEGDCAQTPGLHVAAQSQGDGVYVGPLGTDRADCANPGQFEKQVATLTGSSLRFAANWRSRYVGAPTLASSRNAISDVQWDVLVEGSSDLPELEPVTHVGYAIGQARDTTDPGAEWSTTDWQTSDGPKLGENPPSCIDAPGTCVDGISVREPYLLAELNPDRTLRDLVLAFARELSPDPPDVYGLQVLKPLGSPTTPLATPLVATVSPDDLPECVGLRDPALIPVDPTAQNGYWLLYTCIQGPAPPTEIHALRLSRALEVIEEAGQPLRRVVLRASELGPFAAGGIRSPEPVITFTNDTLRLRIWFLARTEVGGWSVALAEARTRALSVFAFELPEALPFVVNPVLTEQAPLVRSDCLTEECSITGIAVTQRADDPDTLRFLLARRMLVPDGSRIDQLIPLEQVWRLP